MAKLDKVIESVLRESLVDDAAELVGIESEDAEARISGLSFANYLELGNAIEMEDEETAKEILGTVSPIENEIEEEFISGRSSSNAKNYLRKGGNDQQFKWRIELNNGKVLLRWADSRYNATHGQISPEQHIIGVKSVKKIKVEEADNPYAAPKAAPAPAAATPPSAGSSIDALAQPNNTSQDIDNEANQRKEVDDLAVGDDIEVIDITDP